MPAPSNVPWASPASAGGSAGQGLGGPPPGMNSSADDPLAIGADYSSASSASARHGRPVHGKKKKDDSAIVGIAFGLLGLSALIVICFVAMYLSAPHNEASSENQPLIGPGAPVIIIRKKAPTNSSPPKPAAKSGVDARSDQGKPVAQKTQAYHDPYSEPDIGYVPHLDKSASINPPSNQDQGGNRVLGPIHSDDDIRPEDIRPGEPDKRAEGMPRIDLPPEKPPATPDGK